METRAELIRDITQIAQQFKAEIPGGRRPWPKAVKDRALALVKDGMSLTEIAAATGLSPAAIAHLEQLATAAQACSVDETDVNGDPLHAVIDNDAACPARSAETVDTYASLHAALAQLPSNHARVLRRYYLEDATLDDIATELGVSKERVRQIREAAEKKLREEFVVLALWQSVLSRH